MIVSNANEIFSKIHKEDFLELLEVAYRHQEIPVNTLYQCYLDGNKILDSMREQWEKSLENGPPMYELYSHDAYLNESFVCWKEYSRRYLLLLRKYLSREDSELCVDDVQTILDLGCGCAYSTVGLKALFPKASVYGTNLMGTLQYEIDESVLENIDGCQMIDESRTLTLPSVELVFASEFFEHLTEPIKLLEELLATYSPKYFVFANTFTKMSIGHFFTYTYDGEYYTGKEMSRKFNNVLRDHGYVKVQTGFFNNRPQVFKRGTVSKQRKLFEVNNAK